MTGYFGKIKFDEALRLEEEAFLRVRAGGPSQILGFETGPVITLGRRASAADLEWSEDVLAQRGFEVHRLERGGQATLHNPGQLVIFPIHNIRDLGAKAWVRLLLDVSARTLGGFGVVAHCRAGQPGLYTEVGKIAAVGLRLREGISTHGVSINVSNELGDFASIRPCGVRAAPVDRVGGAVSLEEIFAAWRRNFSDELSDYS